MKTIPKKTGKAALIASVAAILLAPATHASTLAYWRFEEGPLGAPVPAGSGGEPQYNNTVLDSSGNGNHMRTWADWSAPSYGTTYGSPVPQTGATNNYSLNFGWPRDIYTEGGKPINSANLTNAFTIEASILMTGHSWQVFVGKDGSPGNGPSPTFALKGFGDSNQPNSEKIFVTLKDTGGNVREIFSLGTLALNTWYHAAVTYSSNTLSFYLMSPGDTAYQLQGSIATDGGIYNLESAWSVGRGQWDWNNADWLNGRVDEVRISDTALSSDQFLNAVPEPATAGLLLGAVVVLSLRRRRQTQAL